MGSGALERAYASPQTEAQHRRAFPDNWERYEFAAPFCDGMRVLDVACGSGFGTAYLTERSGRRAYGLDIDRDTIDWCRRHYGEVADFAVIANDSWPAFSAAFDAIVSMETIEHVKDVQLFLHEVERNLRPGGLFIISTPRNDGATRYAPSNPFHVREYSWEEFGELIGAMFAISSRWSQVSQVSEWWHDARTGPRGRLIAGLSRLVPARFRQWLAGHAINSLGLQRGRVVRGDVSTAGVQLVVARKRLHQ
jgi:SAM-dependent methyltransferase